MSAAPPQIVQLEMEKLSIQRSADTDKHAGERLHAIDDQLVLLKEEQQARPLDEHLGYVS